MNHYPLTRPEGPRCLRRTTASAEGSLAKPCQKTGPPCPRAKSHPSGGLLSGRSCGPHAPLGSWTGERPGAGASSGTQALRPGQGVSSASPRNEHVPASGQPCDCSTLPPAPRRSEAEGTVRPPVADHGTTAAQHSPWPQPLLLHGRPLLGFRLIVQGHLGLHARVDGHT